MRHMRVARRGTSQGPREASKLGARAGRGLGRMACWALPVLAAASCGFPDYAYRGNAEAGSAGDNGDAGGANGGNAPLTDAGGVSGSGGTAVAGSSDGGDAGFAGQAEPACTPIAPQHPSTCFDGKLSGNETDVDCGGGACQACFQSGCLNDSDCLAGGCVAKACTAPVTVQYQPLQSQDLAPNIAFRATLTDARAPEQIDLKTLSIRYYFHRNGVAEPLDVPLRTATITVNSASGDITSDTVWEIIRTADGTSGDFDAYLNIRFTGSHLLSSGDSVTLEQSLAPGNMVTGFDQRTHYSYGVGDGKNWGKITAYSDDQLVWGYEPRGAAQGSCFVQAVNFDGPAVTIGADSWTSDAASALVTDATGFSQGASIYPSASGPLAQVIQTGYALTPSTHVTVPVPNGQYLAYVYGFSNGSSGLGTLSVQGVAVDDFQGGTVSGVQTWGKLGPYAITVKDTGVLLGCTKGSISLSGLELRSPGTASY